MLRYTRLLAVVVFVAALWAVFHFTGLRGQFTPQFVQQFLAAHRVAGLLVFVALFSVGNLAQIPGWIFLAAAVLTMGEFWGGLATYMAAVASCAITFLLIRLLGGSALRTFDGRLARRIFAQLDSHPVRSVGSLRLLFQTMPALNYALALSGVRFRSYVLGTLLGLPLPIALYCVFFETLAGWLDWPIH